MSNRTKDTIGSWAIAVVLISLLATTLYTVLDLTYNPQPSFWVAPIGQAEIDTSKPVNVAQTIANGARHIDDRRGGHVIALPLCDYTGAVTSDEIVNLPCHIPGSASYFGEKGGRHDYHGPVPYVIGDD